jgi:hypothetical protein
MFYMTTLWIFLSCSGIRVHIRGWPISPPPNRASFGGGGRGLYGSLGRGYPVCSYTGLIEGALCPKHQGRIPRGGSTIEHFPCVSMSM